MPEFIEAAVPAIEAAWPGTEAVAFGHLGDGNVHFHVLGPKGSDMGWTMADGKQISHEVYDLVTEWGGSISAEHGIGIMKRDLLPTIKDPVAMDLMRALKKTLDPNGILNPGKVL
jgi:FAD/FMN-containing dehydrogenase